MRRHVSNKTLLVCALLLAGAAVSGTGVLVSRVVEGDPTPAPSSTVTAEVAGPDYDGYAYALGNLGVYDAVAESREFVDSLCLNLRAGQVSAGVVRGHLAGFRAPYDYDESTLLAIASDAKAFVCYR